MKKLIMFGLLLGGGLLWAASAQAISLGFDPSDQTVNVGEEVWVDVNISGLEAGGLDEIVSAYDLDVMFDSNVIEATGVTFADTLGFSFQDVDLSNVGVASIGNAAELSLEPDAFLQGLQGDSFTLFTIHFDAVGAGWSDLKFVPDPNFGVDVKGLDATVLGLTAGTAQVHVNAVPEPASLLLFGTGMLGLMGYGWRRRQMPAPPQVS